MVTVKSAPCGGQPMRSCPLRARR